MQTRLSAPKSERVPKNRLAVFLINSTNLAESAAVSESLQAERSAVIAPDNRINPPRWKTPCFVLWYMRSILVLRQRPSAETAEAVLIIETAMMNKIAVNTIA